MTRLLPKELVDLTLKFSSHDVSMHQTALGVLRIARSDQPTTPIHRVYSPSLCFIVQGEKDSIVGGRTYRYGASQYLVNSIAVPVTGQITRATKAQPYLCIVLEISPEQVYEIVNQSDLSSGQKAPSKNAVFVETATPDLSDAMLRLMRTLKDNNELEILSPLILREITFRLLHSKYGPSVRQIGIAGSQIQRIAKAVQVIRKDFAVPLKVSALAKIANMSPSTFHQHFKEVTKMSPLQYQKQIRLQEARRLLAAELSDSATVGFRVGYESPSQFSREYARMFGAPPMTDIKRIRKGL